MKDTLYTDRYTFMIISRSVLLTMGIVLDNIYRMKGTLYTDRYTFMIISRSVLLRMGNISDNISRENQNTHFALSNSFPKIALCMTNWKNIVDPDMIQ